MIYSQCQSTNADIWSLLLRVSLGQARQEEVFDRVQHPPDRLLVLCLLLLLLPDPDGCGGALQPVLMHGAGPQLFPPLRNLPHRLPRSPGQPQHIQLKLRLADWPQPWPRGTCPVFLLHSLLPQPHLPVSLLEAA